MNSDAEAESHFTTASPAPDHPTDALFLFSFGAEETSFDDGRSELTAPYEVIDMQQARSRLNVSDLRKLSTSTSFLNASNGDTLHDSSPADAGGERMPSQRSRSILNLTSSTLFGIYSPTSLDTSQSSANPSEPPTPMGAGAQTPLRAASIDGNFHRLAFTALEARNEKNRSETKTTRVPRRRSMNTTRPHRTRSQAALALGGRVVLLASLGYAYGEIIRHLHGAQQLASMRVDTIDQTGWLYMAFWCVFGVFLGFLMPWLDRHLPSTAQSSGIRQTSPHRSQYGSPVDDELTDGEEEEEYPRSSLGADWNPIVRSVGAFVGIAFAIRKLPWRSTMQVSMSLALVNPFIWFLIDRTAVGFILSAVMGITGGSWLLLVSPDMVPAPATKADLGSFGLPPDFLAGTVTYESIGVWTWIASVLYCSSILFGNVGRRLAEDRRATWLEGSALR